MNYRVGDKVDEYKLLTECGSGVYGTVFLAEDQLTTRRLALKIVYKYGNKSDRELKGLHQYKVISENTNLLQIYQVKEYEEFFYYTMDAADNLNDDGEYVPDTLGNRLQQGRLKPDEIRKMVDELRENLQILHQKGLFHRDIKPDNILFINNRALLGDIGLVADSALTMLAGTPGFIPSEVLAGIRNYNDGDDYYALGKVIYCALTGQPAGNYPAFPESCTLTDTGDLIKLYNQYCAGNHPGTVQAARERWYRLLPWAVLILLGAITVAINWIAVSDESSATELEKVPDRYELWQRDHNYKLLQVLLGEYTPSPQIMQIYPRLQRIYEEKIISKSEAGLALTEDEAELSAYFENESALIELFENIKIAMDSQGPALGTGWVIKGGGFNANAEDCRSAARNVQLNENSPYVTFRVALVYAPDPPAKK